MSTRVNEIEHWNEAGVSAMHRGDQSEAFKLFQNALIAVRARMQSQRDEVVSGKDASERSRDRLMTDADYSADNSKATTRTVPLPNASFGSTNAVFCLFNHALLVEPDTEKNGLERALATILYNIGLCYHLRGLQKGSSLDVQLGLEYYQKASRLLSNEDNNGGFMFKDNRHLLILALLNNIGFVFECNMRFEDASICLEYIRNYCGSIDESDDALIVPGPGQTGILCFWITAFLCPEWITNPAAAA